MPRPPVFFSHLSGNRANNFDFLRFFLAVMVIYCHAYGVATGGTDKDLFSRLLNKQVHGGILAVDGFFAMSGFLVAASWCRSRSLREFAEKRFLRIYPGFVVAVLFCVVVVGPLSIGLGALDGYFRNADTYKFFDVLLFHSIRRLPGVFLDLPRPATVNDSLWTIRLEIFCYTMVAVLGLLGWFKRQWLVLALFGATYIAYIVLRGADTADSYLAVLLVLVRFTCFFLAGSVFYLYRERISYSWALLGVAILAIALTSRHGLFLTLPLCGPYVLFFAAFSPALKLHDFAQWMRGDLSYGLYLYAYPVEQLLMQYSGSRLTPLSLFALATLVTLGLAALSWHFVEAPCLRRKPRGSREIPPAAGP